MASRSKQQTERFKADDLHLLNMRRIRVALYLGSVALILNGLGWGVFFWLHGNKPIVLVEVALALLGAVIWAMTKDGYIRLAEYLMLGSMFFVLCGMSLFLDIPNAAAPRVTQQYFLVLALYAYLFFQNEKKWLRISTVALFLGAFVFFSSTNIGIVTPYLIPDSVRIGGTWINNIFVVVLLCMLIHITRLDFTARNQLLEDLKTAMQQNQLELYYQAQVDKDGKVWGAEALLRWNHPLHGLIPPDEFIPLAEQSGLILPIGRWVLDTACKQLMDWSDKPEFADISLSVNISAKQFHASNIVGDVMFAIERSGIKPAKLKLELTESILIQDMEDVIVKMTALKKSGVGFALDDFGTGYSSLNYLTRLPLDQLKIDQSFVRDMLTNPNNAAIARTIASLGHHLGLIVIAEGVETKTQLAFLLEHGCVTFQGYYFSHPLPVKAFEIMVLNAVNKT